MNIQSDKGGIGSKTVVVMKDQVKNNSWKACAEIGRFEAYFGDSHKQPNDTWANHGECTELNKVTNIPFPLTHSLYCSLAQ